MKKPESLESALVKFESNFFSHLKLFVQYYHNLVQNIEQEIGAEDNVQVRILNYFHNLLLRAGSQSRKIRVPDKDVLIEFEKEFRKSLNKQLKEIKIDEKKIKEEVKGKISEVIHGKPVALMRKVHGKFVMLSDEEEKLENEIKEVTDTIDENPLLFIPRFLKVADNYPDVIKNIKIIIEDIHLLERDLLINFKEEMRQMGAIFDLLTQYGWKKGQSDFDSIKEEYKKIMDLEKKESITEYKMDERIKNMVLFDEKVFNDMMRYLYETADRFERVQKQKGRNTLDLAT